MEKPAKLFESGASIKNLNPDYVISAFYSFDHKVDEPTKAATNDLEVLVEKLIAKGFLVQVRPGKGVDNVLVFVKLRHDALVKAIKESKTSDFIFSVNNDFFNDELKIDEANKLRIIYQILIDDEHGIAITPGAGKWTFVETIQPIHNWELNKALLTKWSKTFSIEDADIETLKVQYGTKIAFYFAFLKFYLKWLTILAVIGATNFFLFKKEKFSATYTFINLIWAIFFSAGWKFKENNYATKWNVKNISANTLQIPNLKFKPSVVVENYLSNEKSFKYYASWKRYLKKVSFVPIAISFAVALMTWQFVCFFVEIFINELYNGPGKSLLALVPTVMLSVFVPILTMVYKKIVTLVTEWENHKTILSYENSVSEKFFVISFLTSYMALFITTFVYFPFGHLVNQYLTQIELFIHNKVHPSFPVKADHYVINPLRMNNQFFFSMVTNQIVGFFLEYVLPFAQRFIQSKLKKDDSFFDYNDAKDEEEYLQQVRKEVYELGEYDVNEDLKQMVVQFGYVIFFSQCWTIAPLVCLIVNYIQFVGDSTKIFVENKRPIPTRTSSIYPWNQFLNLLVWLSSIISPAITAMYSNSDFIKGNISAKTLAAEKFTSSAVSIESWSLLSIIIFSEHIYFILTSLLNMLVSKIDTKESTKELKETITLKKQFISKYLASSDIQTSDAAIVDKEWISVGGSDVSSVLSLAAKVTKNVKKTTKVKQSNKKAEADAEKPKVEVEQSSDTELINEKVSASGAAYVSQEAAELSQRKAF